MQVRSAAACKPCLAYIGQQAHLSRHRAAPCPAPPPRHHPPAQRQRLARPRPQPPWCGRTPAPDRYPAPGRWLPSSHAQGPFLQLRPAHKVALSCLSERSPSHAVQVARPVGEAAPQAPCAAQQVTRLAPHLLGRDVLHCHIQATGVVLARQHARVGAVEGEVPVGVAQLLVQLARALQWHAVGAPGSVSCLA